MSADTYLKRILYEDELWVLRQPQPALADLLEAQDRLIVIRSSQPPYAVVLGVPHHATVQEDYICEDRIDDQGQPCRRDADKGAASYALVAFTALRDRCVPAKLVIVAHPTSHDPSKVLDSPYCREVFAEPARLLFECHAAGPQRALALELSAGPNRLADAQAFAERLDRALGRRYTWGVQTMVEGRAARIFATDGSERAGELELAALNTCSLIEAEQRGIAALHLEAKPAFCKPADGTNTVTPDGLLLGRALAQAIIGSDRAYASR